MFPSESVGWFPDANVLAGLSRAMLTSLAPLRLFQQIVSGWSTDYVSYLADADATGNNCKGL
jgi:hypothetical protein